MGINDAAARGFQRGADDYERARPGYPDAAIDFLVDELGLGPGVRLLDLAAGTGKLTRQLVPAGPTIVAVEPVAAMRDLLARELPEIEVLEGTAEAIPRPDESVDAVTVAQAFHWFDQEAALGEIGRVLIDGGGLALVWNVRDETVDWVRRFTEIIIEGAGGTPYRRDYTFGRWQELFAATGRYTQLRARRFEHRQVVDRDLVVTRAASTSFVSALPDDRRADLLRQVRDMLDRHPDLEGRERFEFPHQTDVFWCRRR